ncbi:periplasmic solute-binding protein [Rhodospirillales bacterium TMPK1]|uniref:High-affinity zinc uptake system protein ZnuA n=1 Tax=Roseiterribacter gracilis TaxID=2812848 RepID=A0A8S8X724_9PROT|nr:periplasmic solute-binding protein [Rhodospirillales bacterium TMPK1]
MPDGVVQLLPTGFDPERFTPRPGDLAVMQSGDLLLRAGAGFDDWATLLARRVQRADLATASVDLSRGIALLEVKGRAVEASDGHAHGSANPHWWLDPVNAKTAVASIAAALLAADPAREAVLSARLDAFNASLNAGLARWSAALAPYANQPVLAYHNSFPYLARRFRLDIAATVELREGVSPGPARLAEIADIARSKHVRLLLVEQADPGQLTPALTRAAALTPVALPSNGEAPGETYVAMMDALVARLADAFAKVGA